MDQVRKLIGSIPPRQRWIIAGVVLVLAGGLLWFVRWQKESSFKPLYQALNSDDASAVLAKLKEAGVEYRLSDDGATILAPADRIPELRLQMAGSGLPKSGRIGFELFDKTHFGSSDFAEQVNYRRALEGELERSIMAMSEVEQARVHITFAKDSLYTESRQPAKASVLVRLRNGARLDPQNIQAVTHLVSSAVEGLNPEAVSLLDMQGNLLSRPRKQGGLEGEPPSEAMLEHQQSIEKALVAKVSRTLESLVGPGRFQASVSVDCDFTSGEQSEELFDPAQSVMVTSQRTEDTSTQPFSALAGGVPGTTANLPQPRGQLSRGGGGMSRRTENITYQSSRTVKRTRMPQGSVRRMSVAVLIDQDLRWERDGKTFRRVLIPPSAEHMKSLRDLIAGAVGLREDRGDVLIVESMPFETTLKAEPPPLPEQPPATRPRLPVPVAWLTANPLIGGGIAGGIAVAVAAFWFLRRRRARKAERKKATVDQPLAVLPPAPDEAAAVLPAAGESGYAPNPASPAALEAAPDPLQTIVIDLTESARKQPEIYAEVLAEWLAAERTS